MRIKTIILVAVVLGGLLAGGARPDPAMSEPSVAARPLALHALAQADHQRGARIIPAAYRSYMEGRGFQSYQQERPSPGPRTFGDDPGRGEAGAQRGPRADPERPFRLSPRFYGPGDSRCAGWSRRCDKRWGGGNPDYYGCMRYHGCR